MVRLLSSCRQRLAGCRSARAGWGTPALPFSFRRYGDAIKPPCSGFLLTPDRDFSFPDQCSRKYHFLASLSFGSKQKSVKVIGIGSSVSKDRDKSPCLHCQRDSTTGESLSSLTFLHFGLWQKPWREKKNRKKEISEDVMAQCRLCKGSILGLRSQDSLLASTALTTQIVELKGRTE